MPLQNILELFRDNLNEMDILIQKEVYAQFKKLVIIDIRRYIHDFYQQEEVIQMSFFKASLFAPKLKNDSNINAWLKVLSKNTAIDYLRKTSKIIKNEFIGNEYIQINQRAEQQVVIKNMYDQELIEKLFICINQLNENEQVLIKHHYLDGKPYSELQKELSITEPVLTQRMSRARKKLKKLFQSYTPYN